MRRLRDLTPEQRLDMIEETRWQYGQEYAQECIDNNAEINGMCQWSKTRQGASYWAWIDKGSPSHEFLNID